MEVCLHANVILCLVTFTFVTGLAQVYYITPSPEDPCPTEATCLTLSQFANSLNSSYNHVETNVTLIFLSEHHGLEKELVFENIDALFMLSNSTSTVITCYHHTNLRFTSINIVRISNLNFIGCAGNVVKYVNYFVLKESTFTGLGEFIGTALKLSGTVANLVRSSFISNKAVKLYSVTCYYAQEHVETTAGGAIVSINSSVVIMESSFVTNRAEVGGAVFSVLHSNITTINSINFLKEILRKRLTPPHHAQMLAEFCMLLVAVLFQSMVAILLTIEHRMVVESYLQWIFLT